MAKVDFNKLDRYMQMLEHSKSKRMLTELGRYASQIFVENGSFYKVENNTLTEQKKPNLYRNIARTRKMLRGLKNTITKNDPRWNTKKIWYKEEPITDEERMMTTYYLQDRYEKNHIKEKIKDLIHHSLILSCGFWHIKYDANEGYLGDVCVEGLKAREVYIDPEGKLDGPRIKGRWVIKCCPVPTSTIENIWDVKVSPDNKMSESVHEENIKTQQEPNAGNSIFGTAMVYYIYEQPDQSKNVTLTIYINGHGVVKDYEKKDTGMDRYPIIAYQPERMGGRLYPTPWLDPVIELNKSLNNIRSNIEERTMMFAKGRWAARNDENISSITDQNGQIVYYDNIPPTYMQPGTPGNTPFQLASATEGDIEDVGGLHSESMGKLSGSNVRSGSQIAQIQAGDMQNVAEPVDNLESFLSEAGSLMLEIASKQYSLAKKIYIDGKDEPMEIIGSEATEVEETINNFTGKAQPNKKAKKIKPYQGVTVKIVPGSAYSDLQARQDVIDLRNAGIQIPDEVVLETFQFGNIQEILDKMKIAADKEESPDVQIANGENKKMIMGQTVHANTSDDHRIHMAIHAKLLQAVKDNDQVSQLLMSHIKEHEALTKPAPTPIASGLADDGLPPPEQGNMPQ